MNRKEIFRLSEMKLKVDSLQQRVYVQIKNQILTNRLQPGQSISIDQLSSDLGISHTPVREALAMLKLDGLVTTGYHKTPQVTDIDENDVKEIYDIRILLEGYAIKQAINLLTNEDMAEIRKAATLYIGKEDSEDLQELLAQSDINLHGLIIAKVENNFFFRLYGLIEDMSLRIRTLVMVRSAENIEIITKEHIVILEALEQKDIDKAYKAIVDHLTNARERTLKALAQMNIEST